jgi:ParB family chromosome partitioning protein
MQIATPEEIAAEEAKTAEQFIEFTHLPINQIVTAEQIRGFIDTGSEGFAGLMESIQARGVLEPVLVTRQDGNAYRLIIGERRLRACQMLNMETIPARIIGQADTKGDVITLQLIENLSRENLDPIDEANAYLEFFRTKIGAIDAAGMISLIMTYDRDPNRVASEFAASLAAISKITGKSNRSMRYLLSLLRLPRPFQAAVKEGKIGLTQGYLFAENLDNPKLYEIFEAILKRPVTYEELKYLLDKAAGKGRKPRPRIPFSGFYSNIKTVRTAFEKGKASYAKADMEKLLGELEAFCALLKEEAGKGEAETGG